MTTLAPHLEAARQQALAQSCASYARRARWALKRAGGEWVGPCPRCGGDDRFSLHEKRNVWNCRMCEKGGYDVIGMVMHLDNVDFKTALERILGRPVDGLKGETAEAKRKREAETEAARQKAERAAARREAEAERYRQRAIKTAHAIVLLAGPALPRELAGPVGPVARYLDDRDINIDLLRAFGDQPLRLGQLSKLEYKHKVAGRWQTLHTGPAMIGAVMLPDGTFGAVHQTWLAQGENDIWTKAEIRHPENGEILPAKKVLGSKKGGAIRLYTPEAPRVLVAGEGIETTLSVMARSFSPDTAYWCLVDLGNMAGRMARDADGRARPAFPDMGDTAAFVPPDWCAHLIFLGDADAKTEADYQKTVNALTRGARRAMASRPGLTAAIAMAERGKDFNDMAREGLQGAEIAAGDDDSLMPPSQPSAASPAPPPSFEPPSRPAGASPAPPASFSPPSRPAGASPAPPPIGARDKLGASEGTAHGGGSGEGRKAADGGLKKEDPLHG